jgi:hypothetical protein
MSHPLSKIIPGFDLHSYYAGITMAFAEVVGAGCKQLALSSPYSHEIAQEMFEASEYAAKEYGVELMVEPELIVTKLFSSDIAKDKTVILIARDQSVLDEYKMIKKLKKYSDEEGNPDDLEVEIAQRFGKLLSYDEAIVNRLLEKNG